MDLPIPALDSLLRFTEEDILILLGRWKAYGSPPLIHLSMVEQLFKCIYETKDMYNPRNIFELFMKLPKSKKDDTEQEIIDRTPSPGDSRDSKSAVSIHDAAKNTADAFAVGLNNKSLLDIAEEFRRSAGADTGNTDIVKGLYKPEKSVKKNIDIEPRESLESADTGFFIDKRESTNEIDLKYSSMSLEELLQDEYSWGVDAYQIMFILVLLIPKPLPMIDRIRTCIELLPPTLKRSISKSIKKLSVSKSSEPGSPVTPQSPGASRMEKSKIDEEVMPRESSYRLSSSAPAGIRITQTDEGPPLDSKQNPSPSGGVLPIPALSKLRRGSAIVSGTNANNLLMPDDGSKAVTSSTPLFALKKDDGKIGSVTTPPPIPKGKVEEHVPDPLDNEPKLEEQARVIHMVLVKMCDGLSCISGIPREQFDQFKMENILVGSGDDLLTDASTLLSKICNWIARSAKERSENILPWANLCEYQPNIVLEFRENSLFLGRFRILSTGQRISPFKQNLQMHLTVQDEIEQTKMAVKVCIFHKSLNSHQKKNEELTQKRFLREAVLLTKTDHPNLSKVLDFGSTGQLSYQMMDLLEGQDLATQLVECSQKAGTRSSDALQSGTDKEIMHSSHLIHSVPEMNIIEMLLSLCNVLEYMHGLSVVHSAITPSAIWLEKNSFEKVRLLKWWYSNFNAENLLGDSVPLLHLEPHGPGQWYEKKDNKDLRTEMFTEGCYISPLQAQAILDNTYCNGTEMCDIYALGVVAYECVTLKLPYSLSSQTTLTEMVKFNIDNKSEVEIFKDRVLVHVANLEKNISDIKEGKLTSDDFLDIVTKMLDKKNRYSKISELKEDLKNLYSELQSLPPAMHQSLDHLRWSSDGSPQHKDKGKGNQDNCLDLSSGQRTDFISRYLAKFASKLTVDKICISSGVIPLSLIRNPDTRILQLSGCNFASHDVMVLARTFHTLNNLEELDLSENSIAHKTPHPQNTHNYNYAGFETLAEAISGLHSLQHLDMSCNSLGGRGGEILCSGIQHCRFLRTIRLAFCELMPPGGIALAKILHHLPFLSLLDLSFCFVGDDGATELATAIQTTSELEVLSLFGNSIGSDGANAIMNMMDYHNFTLLDIALGENSGILQNQITTITQALAFNNQYRSLKIKNENFGETVGCNLMFEALTLWARKDPFVAKRLPRCLAQAKDKIGKQVLKMMTGANGELMLQPIVDFKLPVIGNFERRRLIEVPSPKEEIERKSNLSNLTSEQFHRNSFVP